LQNRESGGSSVPRPTQPPLWCHRTATVPRAAHVSIVSPPVSDVPSYRRAISVTKL